MFWEGVRSRVETRFRAADFQEAFLKTEFLEWKVDTDFEVRF